MIELAFYSGSLRLIQALVLAAPTLLTSLFVAAVFRRLLGPARIRQLFGSAGLRSLLQSWAIGMLLPGCSLGVIPICRELRRAGLTGGAVLAFALSQPLFDPLSVLYGLTLSRPLAIFAFAACSLALVVVVGTLWERLHPQLPAIAPAPSAVAAGWPRLASLFLTLLREAAGPSLAYIALGLFGTALLGVVLPQGALARAVNADDRWAPWTMTWVAIPAYATPTLAMSQLGSMFQHGNSAGAALQLLLLGAGLNVGLLAWVVQAYGWRRAGSWSGLLVILSLAMAYLLDRPLRPWDVEPADHTHAFDVYCAPFHAAESHLPLVARQKLSETLTPPQTAPLLVFGSLVLLGTAVRWLDPQQRLEAWLERDTDASRRVRYDLALPDAWVASSLLVGLFALSVAGCYAYYPAPQEVFAEMQIIRAEALLLAQQQQAAKAAHQIDLWDRWTRRLEVGTLLRAGRLTPHQRTQARILRDKLEQLRHELEEGDPQATRDAARQVNEAYQGLRHVFQTHLAPPHPSAPDRR